MFKYLLLTILLINVGCQTIQSEKEITQNAKPMIEMNIVALADHSASTSGFLQLQKEHLAEFCNQIAQRSDAHLFGLTISSDNSFSEPVIGEVKKLTLLTHVGNPIRDAKIDKENAKRRLQSKANCNLCAETIALKMVAEKNAKATDLIGSIDRAITILNYGSGKRMMLIMSDLKHYTPQKKYAENIWEKLSSIPPEIELYLIGPSKNVIPEGLQNQENVKIYVSIDQFLTINDI